MRVYRLIFCCSFSTSLYYNCSYCIGVISRTAKQQLQFKKSTSPAPYTHMHTSNYFFLSKKWGAETAALTVNQESTVTALKSMT